MIPAIVCRKCGGEVEQSDTFCSKCGEKIEWFTQKRKAEEPQQLSRGKVKKGEIVTCQLCGNQNPADSDVCVSCGAALGGPKSTTPPSPKRKPDRDTKMAVRQSLNFLQSWKLPASVAIVGITLIIIFKSPRQDSAPGATPAGTQGAMPPGHEEIVKLIQDLQKQVDENPKDKDALLKLANAYYDQKIFPRAITFYNQYLVLNPSDANARVDLGTSYFQMGLTDSTQREQYLASAISVMEKALTYAPKHQLAFYNLGMVNLHTGDMDKANEWFKKCVKADSTSESGRKAQQFLKQTLTTKPSK